MTEPDPTIEQEIREQAYRLWEQAGCPEGREDEFWRLAEAHILSKGATSEDGQAPPDGPTVA